MREEIRLPQWGMGMTDGEVLEWYKNVGDEVNVGDPLVEIEAAKVTEAVESHVAGVLVEVRVAVGETVDVREVLAVIETSDG